MILNLPYPPSVNHYWVRNRNGSVRISDAGQTFRQEVWLKCRQERITALVGVLQVRIDVFPPDRRKRDIDNLLKGILDALQHAGCYADDNQIADLSIVRYLPIKDGRIRVKIEVLK